VQTEWPKGSGRWLSFPELDRCAWFDLRAARERIVPTQADFINRLEAELV
jgi:predicted NUDIX family NTP pyrophosphohydrolase